MEENKRKEIVTKFLNAVTDEYYIDGGGDLILCYITSREICEKCHDMMPDITIEEVTEYMFDKGYKVEGCGNLSWKIYSE